MLRGGLLHPEILQALAGAGHGSQILIADGNYPCSTTAGPNAQIVYLNLAPGLVTATDVLRALAPAIPIESAVVMEPADRSTPPIFSEFEALLPAGQRVKRMERFAFYEAVGEPSLCLVVATGEQRVYANLLLTIGVVPPP